MKERANPFLKFLDRYVGIILVIFLSIFKRKRRWPKSFKHIAFLKTAGIGDIVLLSAVVEDLRAAYAHVRITLFTGNSNVEAGHLISNIQVIPLPMTHPLKSLKLIRQCAFDLLIDCDPWPRINALLAFFSHSKFTLGFKTKGQHKHMLFDSSISHSFECHELDNYRKLIRSLGVEPSRIPHFKIRPMHSHSCKVALHIFAGGSRAYLKEWPTENWKHVIRFLLEQNTKVILTGGRSDWGRLQEFVLEKNVENCAGKYSLNETARILKACACVVSVDTGIMHLAAATGTHVIGLHGPTSPTRWGAKGDQVLAMTPDLEYHPCIQLGFESICKKNHCMQAITVENVKAALLEILSKKDKAHESLDFRRRQRNTSLAPFAKEIS